MPTDNLSQSQCHLLNVNEFNEIHNTTKALNMIDLSLLTKLCAEFGCKSKKNKSIDFALVFLFCLHLNNNCCYLFNIAKNKKEMKNLLKFL